MPRFPIDEHSKAKIIALISTLIPEAKIYLFGSRARDTNSEWSDIDIALDAGKELPSVSIMELNDIMVATNMPYKVDVVDLYSVSEQMRTIILKEKVIWKS
jgi:uncharacterized protein